LRADEAFPEQQDAADQRDDRVGAGDGGGDRDQAYLVAPGEEDQPGGVGQAGRQGPGHPGPRPGAGGAAQRGGQQREQQDHGAAAGDHDRNQPAEIARIPADHETADAVAERRGQPERDADPRCLRGRG
jgi:hypothetical protein